MTRRNRTKGRRVAGRSRLLPLVAAIVVAAGIGFAASSAYTAGNTVPATNIGQFSHSIGANDLKPAGCASLTLTTLNNGPSGNFTNTTSNTLVLGTSGNNNINDNGSNNCIIGGAGSGDHINGHTGDFCQIGPSPGSVYKSCTTF